MRKDYLARTFNVTQAMISRWGRGDVVLATTRREEYLEIIKQLLRE